MIFDTRIAGIPCQCQVIYCRPYIPAKTTRARLGGAKPPYYDDFIYRILDRKGYLAPWLERKITNKDEERLFNEYMRILEEDFFISQDEDVYT